MEIFKASNLPQKNFAGDVYFLPKENWAVVIDGHTYFGARSKEDLERALLPQVHIPYIKEIY